MTCPLCDAKAVNVTTMRSVRKEYMCVKGHRFTDGDIPPAPEPVSDPEPEEQPGILDKIKRFFA